jgi:hypothetical protein
MGTRQSETLVTSDFSVDRGGNPTGGTTTMTAPGFYKGNQDGPAILITWQNGIVGEDGQTGAFVEDVIEAVLQRLRFFQTSKFRCRENAVAITHIEDGLNMLDARTRKRELENVENTYKPHSSEEKTK